MVNTKSRGTDWLLDSPPRLAIAKALLDSPRPLTPGELARKTRRDQSNVRRMAGQMAAEGLLVRYPPGDAGRRVGRKPTAAYGLASGEKAALESHLKNDRPPGTLRNGQQLVFASIDGQQLLDVMEVMAKRGSASEIDWTASVDGSRQERMMVFEGEDALERADDLMAALTALKVECSRGSIADIATGKRSIEKAKRVSAIAAETALDQASRQGVW